MDEKGKRPVKLTPLSDLSDLFTTQQAREDSQREKVMDIPLSEISDFPDHPFLVVNDEAMQEMAESVKQVGVLVPAVVRPKEGGGYEMVAGHRRKMASALAGLSTMPCIVRNLTDDEAIIAMVDANLQRDKILPSEKARAYKMKLDAMKRQGKRTDLSSVSVLQEQNLTSAPVGPKSGARSNIELAAQSPDSKTQIQRFIRLNELIGPILSMVDEGKLGMRTAVELSYLPEEDQKTLYTAIDSEKVPPSMSQAQRLRKLSKAGELNDDTALSVMMEQKKPPLAQSPKKAALSEGDITIPASKLRTYFPSSWDQARIEDIIYKLLEGWMHSHEKHRTEQEKKRGRTGLDR